MKVKVTDRVSREVRRFCQVRFDIRRLKSFNMAQNNTDGTQQKDASQWIFIINNEVVTISKNKDKKPTICKLRHPKTDAGCMFLFSSDDHAVYEITKFKERCRSWFIDQTVQQDGGMYITSKVDPTYLLLPYLIKAEKSGKYQILDQLVTDDDYPECGRLCNCVSDEQLAQVADVKGTADIKAYKFNKEKAQSWLKRKVEQVADKLQSENINVLGSSQSHIFVRSSKESNACIGPLVDSEVVFHLALLHEIQPQNQLVEPEQVDKRRKALDDYVRFAHGIVSDYISFDVSQELRAFLGIKDPEPPKHEKPDIVESASKKVKTEKVEASEDYTHYGAPKDEAKKTNLSAAQNKLSKVDKKGMKSISSFFSPKAKK